MARQAIETDSAPTSPSYSQAVVAGNLVFVSGTVGKDMSTGRWPAVTAWLPDPAHGAAIAEVYSRAFPDPPPARSAPVVSGFPIPDALISIEAIAVRPT